MENDAAREERHAQAVRFLVSLQASKKDKQHDDESSQRDFLRSKGLDEAAIDRAYADARRPEHLSSPVATEAAAASPTDTATDAFDRARRQFDSPLSPSSSSEEASGPEPQLPPKTYPRSPLALYQDRQATSQAMAATQQQQPGPTTRYEVLLAFFRSMSYFLMLGGGFAAVLVGLYRAYMLPRLVSTLDARSELLKHHHDLYSTLHNRVKKLRSSAGFSSTDANGTSSSAAAVPKRGVLKRVQFADEVGKDAAPTSPTSSAEEIEDKKEAGDVVLPGTDVVVSAASVPDGSKEKGGEDREDDEKRPLLEGQAEEGETEKDKVIPIDVTAPLRSSLSKLAEALKADASSQALLPPSPATTTTKTPTVADEESDGASEESDDEDELEFDPFAPPKTSSSKKKHTSTSTSAAAASTTSGGEGAGGKATSLRSSLSAINANIAAQMYTASASHYGPRSFNTFASSITSSFGASPSTGSSNGASAEQKTVDVAQVRADIRNLKGLLLSRRNFPIYARPSLATPAAATTST